MAYQFTNSNNSEAARYLGTHRTSGERSAKEWPTPSFPVRFYILIQSNLICLPVVGFGKNVTADLCSNLQWFPIVR